MFNQSSVSSLSSLSIRSYVSETMQSLSHRFLFVRTPTSHLLRGPPEVERGGRASVWGADALSCALGRRGAISWATTILAASGWIGGTPPLLSIALYPQGSLCFFYPCRPHVLCLSVFVFCLHWPFCLHESFRFNRSYNLLGFLSDGASVAGPSRCPIKRWQGQSSTVWSRGPTVGAVITTGSWLRDSRKCRSWIMLWLRRWIRLCR